MNYMVYMRGNRGDYDHWAQLGNRGWSYETTFFRSSRASKWTGTFRDKYHGTGGPLIVSDPKKRSRLTDCFMAAANDVGLPFTPDVNGAQQEGYGHFQATIAKSGRCSSAVAFLHPATTRKNLTVVTNALTTRVLIEKGRAAGVEYLNQGRSERAHAANEIILCGGAINSPQLLLLSGIGPADELRAHGVQVVSKEFASPWRSATRSRLQLSGSWADLSGAGVARDDEALRIDYIRRAANTVWHPVGTCKMGSDPQAVVDDRLRVHGIRGLRVSGRCLDYADHREWQHQCALHHDRGEGV